MMDNLFNIQIDTNEKEFREALQKDFKKTVNLGNLVNYRWAANTRKAAQKEGQLLDIGKRPSIYWYKGRWKKTNSYWDAKAGAYRTKNRKNGKKINDGKDDFLMQRFHITSIARDPYRPLVAKAVVTSLMANLHHNSIFYPKGSIVWSKGGNKWKRFAANYTKKGKGNFKAYIEMAQSSMQTSISEGLQIWKTKVGKDAKV